MASVNLNIPEEAIALKQGHKDYLVYEKSSKHCCKPSGKDVFYVTSILCCAVTLLLLYTKVCIMQENMASNHKDVSNISSTMDPASGADGLPNLKNKTEESKGTGLTEKLLRIRRQDGSNDYQNDYQNGQAWNGGTFGDTMLPAQDNSHPSIHVKGITSSEVGNGDFFVWQSEPSSGDLLFVQNTYVEIQQPGYYFIYSQITYRDTNDFAIGHEVVRKANCGAGGDELLLHSIRTQIATSYLSSGNRVYPEDSGYVGGVFYLSTNDRVGVRPLSNIGGPALRLFVANTPVGSYFGMFMLHLDQNAAIATTYNCPGNLYG